MDLWTTELRRWPMLSVLAFGQISNILTVLVLSRPRLRKNTCSLYLIGASISNTICIFTSVFYFVLNTGFGYAYISRYRALCKLLPYLHYTTLILASWFILLACVDRYCSTHCRVIVRRFSHINIAKRLIVLLPSVTFLIHSHYLICIDWVQIGRCSSVTYGYLLFFYIYYVVVYAFMTPILYGIFAILTIWNVHKTKRAVTVALQRCGTMIQPLQRRQSLNAQILRMLLVQVISFVILTMPLAAWNVYIGISSIWAKSDERRSLEALLSVCFRFLTFINIGSTCVVYAFTARLFRQELWAVLRCQWLKEAFRRDPPTHLFSLSRRIAPMS